MTKGDPSETIRDDYGTRALAPSATAAAAAALSTHRCASTLLLPTSPSTGLRLRQLSLMVVACMFMELFFLHPFLTISGDTDLSGLVHGRALVVEETSLLSRLLLSSHTFASFRLVLDEDEYKVPRIPSPPPPPPFPRKNLTLPQREQQEPQQQQQQPPPPQQREPDQGLEEGSDEPDDKSDEPEVGLRSLDVLLPPLILPGRVDLERYVAGQRTLDDNDDTPLQTENLSKREGSVTVITPQNAEGQSFVQFGCQQSTDRPDMRCQVPCFDERCGNAVRLCESIPICTHVDRYMINRRTYIGILHHALTSEDRQHRAARQRNATQVREQCLALGDALLDSPALESQLGVYEEEKRMTEQRFINGTGAIVMLHIQKSAGTTICEWAKMEGLRVPSDDRVRSDVGKINGKNCNPSTPASFQIWTGSPERQLEWVEKTGTRFIGNEMFMASRLAWGKEISYVTVLRHPFDRLLSHYKSFQPECMMMVDGRRPPVSTSFQQWLTCGEDNVMTRRLCENVFMGPGGQAGGGGPPVAVTEDMLLCAKNRLARFNLVLTVETLELGSELFRRKFGWQMEAPRKGSSHGASFASTLHLNATELGRLRERHRWDLELYAFAQGLACRAIALMNQQDAYDRHHQPPPGVALGGGEGEDEGVAVSGPSSDTATSSQALVHTNQDS